MTVKAWTARTAAAIVAAGLLVVTASAFFQTPASVTLSPLTSPTAGQPGTIVVSLTGNNFPAGTINPADVTVNLEPTTAGQGATVQAKATSVTLVVGTTRRVTFVVPASLVFQTPTAYLASLSGSTASGVAFVSGNKAAITINPPAQIASISPNSGSPGQLATVTLVSQYTNFVQGSTQASFGSGISVGGGVVGAPGPVTVTSPTSATAQISIDSSASPGPRTVTVATGVQTESSIQGFTVAGTTSLISVSPNSGQQGQSALAVTVTGQFTHFGASSVVAFANGAVTAGSPTAVTTTSLTVPVSITAAASLGATSVTVTTGAEIATLANGFSVTNGTPALISVNPNTGSIPSVIPVSLLVTNESGHEVLQFTPTGTLIGAFVTPQSGGLTTPISPRFGPDGNLYVADPGSHSVLRYNGSTGTFLDAFVPPGSGGLSNPQHITFGPDGNLYVAEDTPANVVKKYSGSTGAYMGVFTSGYNLVVPAALVFGPDGNLYIADEVNVLKFNGGTGAFASVFVAAGSGGLNVPVYLAFGSDGNLYVTGTTSGVNKYNGNTGAFISNLVPNTGVESAELGFGPNGNLYLETKSGITRYDAQTGALIAPVVGLVGDFAFTPSVGPQSLPVSLTGQFTHFVQGTTTASFGAGITVASLTVSSATTATAILNINPNATPGTRDISLTTTAEVVTLTNGFTIAGGTPSLTSVIPNSGQQGQQNLLVTIAGQSTNFVQGISQVSFGAGITVGTVTVNNSSNLTAQISINVVATLGTRTVSVTSGAEVASLANSFTVNAASVNQPPVVSAGPDQTIAYPSAASLHGSITDDGLPLGGTLTSRWALFATSGGPVASWYELLPSGSLPSGRGDHAAVYIPSTNRMVIFGGESQNDLWALTNADGLASGVPVWVQEIPNAAAGSPLARSGPSAVFDPVSNQMILFGGLSSSLSVLGDLWTLANPDGAGGVPHWTAVSISGTTPPARWDHVAAYNRTSNRMVVYGGVPTYPGGLAPGSFLSDVWVLTNANGQGGAPIWSQLNPVGTPPVPRRYPYLAYDEADDSLIMFGGAKLTGDAALYQQLNDTWILANATGAGGVPTWTQLLPTNAPTARNEGTATYDPTSNELVIFGGSLALGNETASDILNETWILHNANGLGGQPNWEQVSPVSPPNPRRAATSVFDQVNDRMIIFGGQFAPNGPSTNEMWVLTSAANRPLSTVFLDATVPTTTATFTSPGTYALRLTGNDSQLSTSSDTRVTVLAPNGAPQVNAGPNQTISISQTTLSGSVSDDGLPVGGALTIGWAAISGPGVVTFANSSSASTTATFSQPGSYDLRLTVSDSQLTASSDMTVMVSAAQGPVITSVNPNAGPQGQQNLSVAIIGQFTHFVQGTTQVGFGSGITVSSVSVASPTSLTAQLAIDPNALAGIRTITVTTGSEAASLVGGFAVVVPTNQPPTVSAGPNQTITQSFDALLTAYVNPGGGVYRYDGATGDFAGTFVKPNNGLHIPGGLAFGSDGDLYVSDELRQSPQDRIGITGVVRYDGKTGAFIDQVIPYGSGGLRDALGPIFGPDGNVYMYDYRPVVTGGTTLVQVKKYDGATGAFLGAFAEVPQDLVSSQEYSAAFAFGPTGDLYVSYSNNILQFDGKTGAFIKIFIPGITGQLTFKGPYLYLNSLSFQMRRYDAVTGAFVDLFIPQSGSIPFPQPTFFAPDGRIWIPEGDSVNQGDVRRFDGTTGAFLDTIIKPNAGGLFVAAGGTFISSANTVLTGMVQDDGLPVSGALGVIWSQISGPGAATLASPSSLATAVSFPSPGTYTFRLTATDSVLSSTSDVSVIVNPASLSPSLSFLSPSAATQGQVLTADIGGANTHFATGTTQVSFGPGISVGPTTVNSPTSISVQLTVAANAPIGFSPVTVTTGTESVSLSNAFNVVSSATPFLSLVNPAFASQGQTNLSIAVSGTNTHFVQGLTQLSFGDGVTVNAIQVTSSTTLNALLAVSPTASLGVRTVTATTQDEIASLGGAFTVNATPATSITAVSPNAGQQGQGGPVNIDGQATHFVQGVTQVDFGPGITVSDLNVTCATCLAVQLQIDAGAAIGTRTVTVTTGSEKAALAKGFTVLSGAPILVSLNPASTQQGQTTTVAIVGQSTHFVQGTSQATFGTGVSVNSLTVNSSTTATAILNIDPLAALGARTVTITTGTESAALANGFTVINGIPVLTSISPNSGLQGQQNLSVVLTGQYTHFVQGTTTATFAAGITVVSLTVNSLTSASAVLNIDLAAASGSRTVTLTTGTEAVTLSNAFTVQTNLNQPPQVTTGCNVTVNPALADISFTEYPILPNGRPEGITLGPDCNLWFSADANNIGRITTAGVITLFPTPTVGSIPVLIAAGSDDNLWFAEEGANSIGRITTSGVITEFPTPTNSSTPQGITAGPDGNLWFTEQNANKIGMITTAGVFTEFAVPTHASGPTGITAGPDGNLWFVEETGNNIGTITTAGIITEFPIPTNGSLPEVITVGPDGNLWFTECVCFGGQMSGRIGRINTAGVITEFPILSTPSYPRGITAGKDGNLWFTEYFGNKIGRITTSGVITEFSVPTGGALPIRIATGPDGNLWFTEQVGQIGRANAGIFLTGTVTDDGLPAGAMLSSTWSRTSGPSPVTFSNPLQTFPDVAGQVNPVLTSATFTTLGTYTVTLTGNDSQFSSTANITVTVIPPPGTGVILSVSPNTGQQGQQSLSLSITGQSTNWVQGTTTAGFGAGITVVSLTVHAATSATAVININPGAVLGASTVTMTTGSEVETLANGFTVQTGAPVITLVNPNIGQQGQQNVSITITGQFTHFLQGTTTASFGTGISVVSLTINSPTEVTVVLNIDPATATGAHTVTVTSGLEIASRVNGFTVTSGAPVLTQISPTSGFQGQTLFATITGQFTQFTQSTTQVDLGSGITVNTVAVINTTSLLAQITIDCYAVVGARTVTVTTGSEVLSISNGFVVQTVTGDLLVASRGNGSIVRFDSSGTLLGPFVTSNSGGLAAPINPIFGPDGNLYVVDINRAIRRYSGLTGAFIDNFVPVGVGGLTAPLAAVFGPDGNLYVGDNGAQVIRKYNGTTGAYIGVFNSGGSLNVPTDLVFGPDGNLYVADETDVVEFDGVTGAFISVFVPSGTGGLSGPGTLRFGCDGNLYVGNAGSGVERFNGSTGAFISPAIIPTNPVRDDGGLAFGPNNDVYLGTYHNSQPIDEVLRYSSQTGSVTTIIPAGVVGIVNGLVFRATSGAPTLLTLSPNAGAQGLQNLSVSIVGRFTHFTGASVIDLGTGITANAVVPTDDTHLTAQISIAANATVGIRNLTVTTGSETVTLVKSFTVSVGTLPAITTVSPNAGSQGQGGPVGIVGLNTHFVQGTTQVDFGAGITVSNINVTCPTCLTIQLLISPTATVGPRNVTVTTGSEIAKLGSGFAVLEGTPILTSLNPASGRQGQTLTGVVITGQFTHFNQGATQVSFGMGITVSNVNVTSPTILTAQLAIDPTAAVGTRTLTVTTGTEVVSVANVFNIQAAIPILFSLNPGGGQQGQSNLPVIITGISTHFVQGTSQANFGAGVTVSSLTVASPTTATAVVNIDPTSVVGTRTVSVTTNSEVAAFTNGFTITAASATILSVTPNTGQQGQQNVSLAIVGLSTHFVQGTTTASLGAGVTVASVTVTSTTSATVVINIASAATVGLRDVTSTTGTEVATLAGGFAVNPGPTITEINPNVGQQGQQNLSVSVTTFATHFAQGTTQANFGAGVTVATLTVTSATSATVVLNISSSAASGTRNVTFTTGSEVATASNAFVVSNGAAVLTQLSPNTGRAAQKNLAVTISGQFTNFAQGTSQVNFGGNDITVNSVSVTDSTHLTANISIASTALLGSRPVTVTTGTEVATLANAFTVTVAVNQPPVITIAPSWSVTLPSRLTLNYTVIDDGLPLGGALNVIWETITTPPGAAAGFMNQTANSISVGFDTAGTYILRITATDTQFTVTQDITVTVTASTTPPPTVSIDTPTDGSEVTSAVNVIGSVNSPLLSNWLLEYQGPTDSSFHTLATGTANVSHGTLGTFDPSALVNGIAYIRLTATDTGGQSTIVGPLSLVLTKNLKIGNFTVSFNDLSVPLAGLPIQIIRTYDSRSRNAPGKDFSYGWTLDINAARLSESVTLGDQWNESHASGLSPYCIDPVVAHVVTVALPDGTTYQFQPTLIPHCQSFVPILQATFGFTPIGSTPPNVSLAIPNSSPVLVDGTLGPVTFLADDDTSIFDPDQYILTLGDGRKLQISMQSGLQKMTDLNGNTLTVTSAGITSSSGKSVTFTRNAANLITAVTDPAGNSINYAYNQLTGDLTSVTDRSNNTTTFTYDSSHGLLTIKDPRGIQPIKNVYDNNGLLIQHIDAYGNTINYTHDTGTRQEIITDRLGNTTVNEYDTDGNIVKVTDAAGGVTTRTYDSNDNLLTETNPLGQTRTYTYDTSHNRLTETDALGDTTTYTYNSLSQVLTVTDALSRQTVNTYDASGNLLSTKDAAGNTTSSIYNASGLRTSRTDALGGITAYQYDVYGDLTQQTDPLGNVATYTYNSNGNKLSDTKTRTTPSGPQTLVTGYQYDASSRLTQTTYADGSTTQTQYNAIGQQGVTIDQLGRQTTYAYDLMGRLITTGYPDSTSESATYDAEGDRVTSTDRGGRTTTYVYDTLKRLTQTIYPDTASSTTIYDAASEVTTVKDPLGNATQYGYDAAGRRTQVTDAMGHSTGFTYDALGNQTSTTDANGNTTQYQYDADNRRIKTVYADSTNNSVTYDALGRTISKTDQAGKTAEFQYDKLGRLTQVTDALSQLTKYTYDEVGSRLTQTDANAHNTSFGYDQLGRRTKRQLPLGMSETMAYDAAGNLKTEIDFNGKTTTYNYDAANRLISKIPDVSFGATTVGFAYTATGQRFTMSDPSGTTTYTYDLRDRLLTKATPQGTLTYTYDLAGNLSTIRSSNTAGMSVDYTYDALNRLHSAKDNRMTPGLTTYAYDNAGNLQNYLYPNAVQTTYTYNTLNRLTNVSVAKGATLASYGYTLGSAGNRTQVNELGGRQVNYTYDALYRLTNETIAGGSVNGVIGYSYDPVGNRLSRTSTVGPVPAAAYGYDANDRLAADTYDQDGNTTVSGGNTFTYDFENHLETENSTAVTLVYDGDGNRVSKIVGGVTTKYLVDDRNLTGYTQVLEEISAGTVQRVYTYGLNRISQSQVSGITFYGYDGHGNVRILTDSTGVVTDRYDYDAFGSVIRQAGSTSNVYLYSGEQNDPNLGLYYLRARYLNVLSSRFFTRDRCECGLGEPLALHSYLYSQGDPVNRADPSGMYSLIDISVSLAIYANLSSVEVSYTLPLIKFGVDAAAIADCIINPATDLLQQSLDAIDGPDPDQAIQSAVNAEAEINAGNLELAKKGIDVYKDLALDAVLSPIRLNFGASVFALQEDLVLLLGPNWVALAEQSETVAGYVYIHGFKAEYINKAVNVIKQLKKSKRALEDLTNQKNSGACKALKAASFVLGFF
jgi:RHS repeat-associated protein